MRNRRGLIQVDLDGVTWIFEAKTVSYMHAPDVFPECAHCKSKITTLVREDKQCGFSHNKFRLIIYCEACGKATLAEYMEPTGISF